MELRDSYTTIKKSTDAILLKEKKSKFYGFAFPLENELEVKHIIEDLQKQFPTANHVCYAWQIGVEDVQYRVNDDGEPNNSAGMPIYGQIQSFELTNVLVAVVRFFGGTKLGVGGLISAYKSAAKITLEEAIKIERILEVQLVLKCAYPEMNTVMRLLSKYQMRLVEQKLEESCEFRVAVRKGKIETILKKMKNYHKIEVDFTQNPT